MKTLKITAIIAAALALGACSRPMEMVNKMTGNDEIASLRTAVEEARAAAIEANENSRYARELAEQNAQKINQVFRKNQRK